jgi:hypothetical protein
MCGCVAITQVAGGRGCTDRSKTQARKGKASREQGISALKLTGVHLMCMDASRHTGRPRTYKQRVLPGARATNNRATATAPQHPAARQHQPPPASRSKSKGTSTLRNLRINVQLYRAVQDVVTSAPLRESCRHRYKRALSCVRGSNTGHAGATTNPTYFMCVVICTSTLACNMRHARTGTWGDSLRHTGSTNNTRHCRRGTADARAARQPPLRFFPPSCCCLPEHKHPPQS